MKAPNGYTSRPSGDDPRSTEAWALGEASRRLALAAKMNDGGEALREALRLNQRLWSIFQAALNGSKIQPILDINRAIAEGLAGKAAQPAAARPAMPAPANPAATAGAVPVMRVSA